MTEVEERIAETMITSSLLPESSLASNIQVWENRVVIRPYSPEGKTESGLWVTKNDKWPRIWGWVLAIPERTLDEYPSLTPGAMIVYKRYADEVLGYDKPSEANYDGEKLAVAIIHVDAIEASFIPPLIPVRI